MEVSVNSKEDLIAEVPLTNEQMENLLALQQEILGKVVLGGQHHEILEDLCRIAESMLPNAIASIMLFNDTRESLTVKSAPNMSLEAIDALNGLIPGEHSGSCGTAVYENSPQFVCDTKNDVRWSDKAFQDFANIYGVEACWSLPIRGIGTVAVGSFALSSMEKRSPHQFHKKLLETCADVVAIVLKREAEEQNLIFLAHYDVLTKLPNRTLFLDRFTQAVAHSKRTKTMLAISFLDLDNFKPINDNYGHEVGDKLLIEVARRIKSTIREEDTASRQGGDEFTLLLRDIESFEQCEQLLERVRASLVKPYVIDNNSHKITVSIGTTVYPLDDADLDTLLRHADQAMYQAKLAGKNQQQLFNALDDKQVMQKQTQLLNIKQALASKEFQLYYQPKVNMRTGKVFGAEALIRWIHPEKGLIPPLDFLPLIEGTDLEIQVGGWVINEALQQLDSWKRQGLNLEVSINVSSHHLQSPAFFDQLNDTLEMYPNVNSQDVQLEILESSVLGDIEIISGIIKSCQNVLGVNVALDDFGTGYSSLTHLRSLSANTIKIDQSFVKNMLEDEGDLALIEGIIGLADIFDREVIAEGVETAEHGVLLMRIGCDCAQGYGIARPMPADNMKDWIDNFTPDESWSIWSNSDWEMSNLPLVVAQSDHIKWIEEIFHALDGKKLGLKQGELTNHYECRLGSWYYNHGQKHYGHLEAFSELEAVHVGVHKLGRRIIQLSSDGRRDEAMLLAEDLLALKSKVLDSLNTLQKQVNFHEQEE